MLSSRYQLNAQNGRFGGDAQNKIMDIRYSQARKQDVTDGLYLYS